MKNRLAAVRGGGKPALAKALTDIETRPGDDDITALLADAWGDPIGYSIGLTGPPGVGKSSLAASMIRDWRGQGLRVGVLAIDPSSQISGGALLGDRLRMAIDALDDGVFVRSLATAGHLGGTALPAFPVVTLMRAVFDRVLVETVGVGQNEQDIRQLADYTLLCLQPGSGDMVQFMKSGIMDVPDCIVITKADLGKPAVQMKGDVEAALTLTKRSAEDMTKVLCVSVLNDDAGSRSLIKIADEYLAHLPSDGLADRRHIQMQTWMQSMIQHRAASCALKLMKDVEMCEDRYNNPFRSCFDMCERLDIRL